MMNKMEEKVEKVLKGQPFEMSVGGKGILMILKGLRCKVGSGIQTPSISSFLERTQRKFRVLGP